MKEIHMSKEAFEEYSKHCEVKGVSYSPYFGMEAPVFISPFLPFKIDERPAEKWWGRLLQWFRFKILRRKPKKEIVHAIGMERPSLKPFKVEAPLAPPSKFINSYYCNMGPIVSPIVKTDVI